LTSSLSEEQDANMDNKMSMMSEVGFMGQK
jgi:hypothetical protein